LFYLLLIGGVITMMLLGWFVPFEYDTAGYCGEMPLYRYRFGIYACDLNEEAHPDLQCYTKEGGLMSYLGLTTLDCEKEQGPTQAR
jgi:hypothetical protein